MNIVTLMNYEDERRVLMCKMWLYLVRRFHPEANVTVLHHDRFEGIRSFAERTGARALRTDLTDIPSAAAWTKASPGTECPWMDLTISVWRMYGRAGLTRFLFVEADAFVLGDLSSFWKLSEEKPFIGIAERARWGEIAPYMNMGVYAYNSTDGFLTYEKLFRYWRRCGYRVPYPVGDQGLVNGYFKEIGYSPFHPNVGIEYNCLAANCRVKSANDDGIEVRSGPVPVNGEAGAEFPGYIGWGLDLRVKILHAFGPSWKLWKVPTATALWEYLSEKVAEIERSGTCA